MLPTLINGWYMATDHRNGAWSVTTETPTAEQLHNANIVRSFFLNEGWTINAICGLLGCMQGESTINPAFIQATNRYRLPNSAASLMDVPNSVMKNFYMEYYQVTRKAFAIGIVQWDGYSVVQLAGGGTENQQKLVAYAIRNNIIWYDGWTQMYRLKGEQAYDVNMVMNVTPVAQDTVPITRVGGIIISQGKKHRKSYRRKNFLNRWVMTRIYRRSTLMTRKTPMNPVWIISPVG